MVASHYTALLMANRTKQMSQQLPKLAKCKKEMERVSHYWDAEEMSGYSQFSTSFPGKEEEAAFLSPGLSVVLTPPVNDSCSEAVSSTINCLFADSDATERDCAVSVLNDPVAVAEPSPAKIQSKIAQRSKLASTKRRETVIFSVGMFFVCLLAMFLAAKQIKPISYVLGC